MPSPMASNRHRILRQVLELDLDPGVRGPELQEAVARSFWERTVPELEALFDRAAGPDEILRLDRLEIDLGSIEGIDWEPQFRRRLVEQMARRLAQFRPIPEGATALDCSESQGPEPLRQFLFFLAHGRLPWWGAKPEKGWPESLLSSLDRAGWTALHQLLHADLRARLRLIDSVSDGFLLAAAESFADLPEIQRVLAWLTPEGLPVLAARQWRRGFWAALLDWVLTDGFRSGHGAELMGDLLRLRDGFAGSAGEKKGLAQGARDHREAEGPGDPFGPSLLPPPWREWLVAARAQWDITKPEAESARRRRTRPGSGEPARSLTDASLRTAEDWYPAPPREDEAIYLEGAGAVILHPFLEELFRGQGLLVQRGFRDGPARHRAVHLLRLLSFGREDVPEYELLLAKLLCGLPFEEPLEPAELDDDDRAACDTLLRAVLGHWTALRSGSPDWLRAQFFLREGKLETVDFGWRLTVERRAQDVLLARLPWGLGVIGLPWMEGRIHVRWLE